MLVSLGEIVDFIVMALIVGYIFSDFFLRRKTNVVLDYKAILFAAAITAPAIALHELSHKFVAISLGLNATFHAAYFWLMIGLVLKAVSPGFIFFVPAYVTIQGLSTPLTQTIVSVAGPLTNLALFFIAWAVLALKVTKNEKGIFFLRLTKRINGFLFVFNMIPIPGFDGFQFFSGLYKLFF